MTCRQQLSVRSSVGALEAPSGYALRCLQCIKANRTVYLLQNRTILFATNTVKRRKVTANFNGGDITGNGGLLLLRKIDRLTGLTKQVAKRLADDRVRGRCEHTQLSLLRQRVYALAIGDEDLNDHQQLRHDLALQSAIDRDRPLASPSTLCRWENAATGETARTIHEVMVDQFIASFEKPPTRLVLDVDATDDPVHGMQEHRGFHAYYDHYCFLPLYVFCGEKLLVSYLRPSRIDGAKHSWAILALLTKRLRQVWPKVKLIVRGDSGFCRWRMLNWFDHHDVGYVIGMARNDRLNGFAGRLIRKAERDYQQTGQKQRLFGEFRYGAGSWPYPRRVIAKAEHSSRGSNPRYLVTNLTQSPQYLYDKLYCPRGDMENRIKEQQLGLFADRTSCHRWWPNQFRLLLSSLAYVLMQRLRDIGLRGTGYAKAQVGTIRLTLLKIGAVIIRNTRRVKFFLSSAYPHQQLFCQVVARLDTS